MLTYWRYMAAFHGMYGVTTTKTNWELLFGYRDKFLEENVVNVDP